MANLPIYVVSIKHNKSTAKFPPSKAFKLITDVITLEVKRSEGIVTTATLT